MPRRQLLQQMLCLARRARLQQISGHSWLHGFEQPKGAALIGLLEEADLV
jgi:hypothetical protein